ncbi:hypothetical protein ACRJ4B_49865 [Streptomyces sp. GTA36]
MVIACSLLLAALIYYAALCMARPFGPCRKCDGTGEIERFRKVRTCRRCHGRKLRLRVGRRLHNAWRRTYDDGAR